MSHPRGGKWDIMRKTGGSIVSFKGVFAAIVGVGIVLLIGGYSLGGFLSYTSNTEYCISCHEMKIVFEEYKQTSHFQNRDGVRAECPDCHIPKGWNAMLARKVVALKDLYHHLLGTIDTPEKFEQYRLAMAETVWERMKADDSEACRNCHLYSAMNFKKQSSSARKKHELAVMEGDTCIDCHKGIAHKAVHHRAAEPNEVIELEF